jgi:hypothetical protein
MTRRVSYKWHCVYWPWCREKERNLPPPLCLETHENKWVLKIYFTGCSRNFTGYTGLIQTPYYPEDYPNNIQCAYSIRVPSGHQIALALEFLDLAHSLGCSEDVLEIWNGNSESSVPIGRHCGYLFSQWVRSNGSELNLRFTSDLANTRRGFQLKYYAIKSGTDWHYLVTSPLGRYKGYLSPRQCTTADE